MQNNSFPLLHDIDQKTLLDALHYMKMDELKSACITLNLPCKGKKAELINRIITFIKNGTIIMTPSIPASAQAKSYPRQSLTATSYMLYGSYKNDANTRNLFKKLIGQHFHFTAFGIDWLNDRWSQGLPPTYQEFADYWQQETDRRKNQKVAPKDEWAFINFLQRMQKEEPSARQEDLMHAWKELQSRQTTLAMQLINDVKRTLKHF